MLNPFPIQFLALFAYFLLRLFVAGILYYLGVNHIRQRNVIAANNSLLSVRNHPFAVLLIGAIECVIATFTLIGAHTQYAMLTLMLLCFGMIIMQRDRTSTYLPSRVFYVLLFGAACSLFITSAGAFAVDLPI